MQLGIHQLSERGFSTDVPWPCVCELCFSLSTSLSSVLEIRWILSLPSGLHCLLRNLLSPKWFFFFLDRKYVVFPLLLFFFNRISLFLLLKCLIIFLGVSLLKFILFEICLASSVCSFIFPKILKFSVVLSYHVFSSFNIFSSSLGSDDRVLALLLWSLGTWVLLTVLPGPLMYPASLHQHHHLSCFFCFFSPILFWAHHWRLLNVIIIIIIW